jgi:thiopurine S-methyltransferase
MDADFWLKIWERDQTRFHEGKPNDAMVRHFPALGLASGTRIFLPFCGKTRDIAWFLSQGYHVAGAELSTLAVRQLFDELALVPAITPLGGLHRYHARAGDLKIDIFAGDMFALTAADLGPVDAIYDRAALVALPPQMRAGYAAQLTALTGRAPQFLNCFEYDQSLRNGPPFSVDADEVARIYANNYALTLLERFVLPDGLGGMPASDAIWKLRPL